MKYFNQYIFLKTARESSQPKSPLESFHYFITNSNIELISDSSAFSLVFKFTFNKWENKSPYFYVNSNGNLTNVTCLTLKMLFICDEDVVSDKQIKDNFLLTKENHIIWKYKYQKDKKPMTKHFERRDNFTKEINNMLEASEKSILALNRNTPIAIFSRLYTQNSCNYFFLHLFTFQTPIFNY